MGKISDVEKEDRFGQMDPCMRGGFRTIKPMAKVDLFMLMETSTMDRGRTIRLTVEVSIAIWTAPNMKETGSRTSSMVMVLRLGQMVLDMRGNTY